MQAYRSVAALHNMQMSPQLVPCNKVGECLLPPGLPCSITATLRCIHFPTQCTTHAPSAFARLQVTLHTIKPFRLHAGKQALQQRLI